MIISLKWRRGLEKSKKKKKTEIRFNLIFNSFLSSNSTRSSIIYPTEMIALLDEMFVKCETDDFELNFMPNIPFNDNEEWETLPNSDQIPMDTTTQSPINARSGLLSSIQSASLISSVTNFFRHLGGNTS